MKLSHAKILNSVTAIRALADEPMAYKTSLKISKNIKMLNEALADYQEEFSRLADTYFEKDENGAFIYTDDTRTACRLKPETIDEYREKQYELDHFEIEVNIYPIDPEELEHVMIKPSALLELDFMIADSSLREQRG